MPQTSPIGTRLTKAELPRWSDERTFNRSALHRTLTRSSPSIGFSSGPICWICDDQTGGNLYRMMTVWKHALEQPFIVEVIGRVCLCSRSALGSR